MTARPIGCAVSCSRINVVGAPHIPTLRPRVKHRSNTDVHALPDDRQARIGGFEQTDFGS